MKFMMRFNSVLFFFFFNDTATTEIYTLSLHDALPISTIEALFSGTPVIGTRRGALPEIVTPAVGVLRDTDRKSTRLNSSHSQISYAVFCLKKKNLHHINFVGEQWKWMLVRSLLYFMHF